MCYQFFFSKFLSIFLNIFVKSNYRYFCKNWYFHSWSWPLFKGLASRVGSTTVETWFLMKWSMNRVLEKYFHLVFNKELKKYYLGYEEEKNHILSILLTPIWFEVLSWSSLSYSPFIYSLIMGLKMLPLNCKSEERNQEFLYWWV